MALLIFSHGNSFPASTYGVVLGSLKKRGFTVKSIEMFGHDASYPVTNNWPHLVQQLHDFAAREVAKFGEPAYLLGHSLGGILSMMCAARHPTLVKGVVLLDSPVIGGWRAATLGAIKSTPIMGSFSPGNVSSRRKVSFDNEEAAYAHFKSKRGFAKWDEQALRDYVHLGMHDEMLKGKATGKRVLNFSRDVETQIYNTLPDNLERLLKRHPLKCPVAFIGGRQSEEMKRAGMGLTEQVTQGRMSFIDGGHLFPMEKPLATAALVEGVIRGF
jgi:pimeloyl-ACP methyl ester carboxylesterase